MMKILIVDDSATARMLFKAYIPESVKCEVHEAANGLDAIEIANQVKPDLAVIDYNMPGLVGTDVAKKLQSQGITPRFVLITANTQQSVLDRAEEVGFSWVLEKPITKDKMAALFAGE
ncbi:MAG: response regulator [Legionellales bacterium]|nr:response regulator [Legionellales bacterium]|tara:strand:+ start:8551 stop:8904 length:354 start_codon:yes stop_codon:yes gene_type:complete